MSTRKKIQQSEWSDRFQHLTSGNKGRLASIEAEGNTLAQSKSFSAVNYDPTGKGDDIVISVEGLTHTISHPTEIYFDEADNGQLTAVEIMDKNKHSCTLKFL